MLYVVVYYVFVYFIGEQQYVGWCQDFSEFLYVVCMLDCVGWVVWCVEYDQVCVWCDGCGQCVEWDVEVWCIQCDWYDFVVCQFN